MKSCIFCELIKKESGDHRIFNTWCGDPGKVCHCYFWWWAFWLFCCSAFHWKWCREKNIGFIAFFKVLLLGAVLETIAKENLLVATQAAGDTLLKGSNLVLLEIFSCHRACSGLSQLEKLHPGKLKNSRGRGTFCAVDCRLFNFHEILWRSWW